jgi:phospholipase/carboxylesterase
MTSDPHHGGATLHAGAELLGATGAVVLLHGRGGSAQDILTLADSLRLSGIAYLAPQAAGGSWYPLSFLAPREQNEPWLSSALTKVETTVEMIREAGLPFEQIALCGFSQGACLATEFLASRPRRYAALTAFTGGLIGPPGSDLTHEGQLQNMPALFASGDPDPHVPWQRVEESAEILRDMGAAVELRRYPNRPHTVSADELVRAQAMLEKAFAQHPQG